MLQEQYKNHIDGIINTLEKDFGKERAEAVKLVEEFSVHNDLMEHPIGLHDSPKAWALILLTENEDIKAIKHFHNE